MRRLHARCLLVLFPVPKQFAWRLSWRLGERATTLRSVSIPSIDLNADLGEHDGDGYSRDAAILSVVSSANIACGVHAGSRSVMKRTIAMAYENGVTIGAHPGYPDRPGFGRREIGLPLDSILESFIEQTKAMIECCELEGARLRYVKPHGALYNRAARDEKLADLLAACVLSFDRNLEILGLAGSVAEAATRKRGVTFAREAFIDRGYLADGTLVPRTQAGAFVSDPQSAADRAVKIAREKKIDAVDGTLIDLEADSLCVHGDSEHALETVTAARVALEKAGFTIAPFVK
jgi:UPF0271 protein